jgi:cytochrome c-type biogenesis protein CcmH
MKRLLAVPLLFLFAGAALPQAPTHIVSPEVRRVGENLACKCGACNNTVGSCPMIGCGYSVPARERIAGMQKTGMGDQAIVDTFVKEMGLVALAVPPTTGFHLLGWIMPFIAILLGFGVILIYWKRFRQPASAAAGSERVIDEKYRKRIEADLADLD